MVDELRTCLVPQSSIDIASPMFSLFAFAEVRTLLEKLMEQRHFVYRPASKAVKLYTEL
ncbi:MAG: hypothetical protein HIU83_16005 [Proteobacteria bacterium]|nr:hypothetical protein [Pseudomonadota bacterium]